jgi:hypothetical protein
MAVSPAFIAFGARSGGHEPPPAQCVLSPLNPIQQRPPKVKAMSKDVPGGISAEHVLVPFRFSGWTGRPAV